MDTKRSIRSKSNSIEYNAMCADHGRLIQISLKSIFIIDLKFEFFRKERVQQVLELDAPGMLHNFNKISYI